jgi:hypothetical protein
MKQRVVKEIHHLPIPAGSQAAVHIAQLTIPR